MTIKTLMLSAATGALLMSPALAQDDQATGETGQSESVTVPLDTEATVTINEEVQVPIEGEVTIDVNVTNVEADPAPDSEQESAEADTMTDETGGESSGEDMTTEMADDGSMTEQGGDDAAMASDNDSTESMDESGDQGLAVADEDGQQTEDGAAEEGLALESGSETGDQSAGGEMAEGDDSAQDGLSGTGMAEGEAGADAQDGDVAATDGTSEDGLSAEDGTGSEVASEDGQAMGGETTDGGAVAEGEFVSDEQLDENGETLTEGRGNETTDESATELTSGDMQPGMETEEEVASGDMAAPDYGTFAEMTVDDILSMPVESTDERRVGDIDYLIEREGRIEAVIGVGGFLGLNEYTVALPLEDFQLVDGGDRLFIEHSEDELTAMPEIDESGLDGLDGNLTIGDIAGRG